MSAPRIECPDAGPLTQQHIDRARIGLTALGEQFLLQWATDPALQLVIGGAREDAWHAADGFVLTERREELYPRLYWVLPHWWQRHAFAAVTSLRANERFHAAYRDVLRGPDEGPDSFGHVCRLEALRGLYDMEDAAWSELARDYGAATEAMRRAVAEGT